MTGSLKITKTNCVIVGDSNTGRERERERER